MSCAGSTESASSPPHLEYARGWHYDVELSNDATRAEVTLCLGDQPAQVLVPGDPSSLGAMTRVRDPKNGRALPPRGQGFDLRSLSGSCAAYSVDLLELSKSQSRGPIQSNGESVLVRVSLWLMRPQHIPDDLDATLTLHLPTGIEASTPWPRVHPASETTFKLDRTAFKWLGYTAFGPLRVQRFRAANSDIEIAVLNAPLKLDDRTLRQWASDAVNSAATLYGHYPRPSLQILVVPVDGRQGLVQFGLAARGGGSGVLILMNRNGDPAKLKGGWTTVHELLHHGLPFIDDAWMAEGWVSYYTELTRTRMGHRDEREGWQKLYDAFKRGQRGGPRTMSLQETSDRMHNSFAYQYVYWSGAAIALLTDIALRQTSGNTVGLDEAMLELRRCCGEAPHMYTAQELLEWLDTWHGTPLFTTTAAGPLSELGFPAVEPALAELGIRVVQGRVELDDDHPGAPMRRAIMLGHSAERTSQSK